MPYDAHISGPEDGDAGGTESAIRRGISVQFVWLLTRLSGASWYDL
jgi:hypothetical protein